MATVVVPTVTREPKRKNSQKRIRWPPRSAKFATRTFAEAAMTVRLPPKSAPSASDHQRTSLSPPKPLSNSRTTGIIAAV